MTAVKWWREHGVSPPTRGWTRSATGLRQAVTGFPAHAGMDLPCVSQRGQLLRFPRPRGDGPLVDTTRADCPGVSPPTRGWTSHTAPRDRGAFGFPAHAGMDPTTAAVSPMLPRFPRPRGDGPFSSSSTVRMKTVSPPTRGWTAMTPKQQRFCDGFPAHAGMDLTLRAPPLPLTRFPRPRGDGP